MTIIDKLKIIRIFSGSTQEKLAKELGVSFVSFNSWINGKSKPRKKTEESINNLYFRYTGQRDIPEDPLKAKKLIILNKSKRYKDVLGKIVKNSDIYDQFLLVLTYHTNKLEGSALTENETRAILFDNIALPNRDIIEQLEVKNHQAALQYLWDYLCLPSHKINEVLILKLHGILMNGIKRDAGIYRRHGVRIVGTYVPTANYLRVPQLMKELAEDINRRTDDIITHVSNIHSRFEKIHPFSDGNGRIGRLILSAMLLANNLPPAIVKQQKKRFYNSCLKRSQLKGDFLPIEDFVCDSIIEGFKVLERK